MNTWWTDPNLMDTLLPLCFARVECTFTNPNPQLCSWIHLSINWEVGIFSPEQPGHQPVLLYRSICSRSRGQMGLVVAILWTPKISCPAAFKKHYLSCSFVRRLWPAIFMGWLRALAQSTMFVPCPHSPVKKPAIPQCPPACLPGLTFRTLQGWKSHQMERN